MKNKLGYYFFAIMIGCVSLIMLNCGGKKKKNFDNMTAKVVKVINGNTIQLDNGLTVHLLGVSASTSSENFLKTSVLDRRVSLTADHKSAKPSFYNGSKDNVWAYVKVYEDGKVFPLNGDMIRNRITDVNVAFVADSLQVFTQTSPEPPMMGEAELAAKMKPATFMIMAHDGQSQWLGTGFYISKDGLAITNDHVLPQSTVGAYVSMPNGDGRIDGMRKREIKRILYSDPQLDYTVFQVGLDPGETVPYLELAKKQAVSPDKIAVVGNPLGDDALFTEGIVSQVFNEKGKIAVTANITSGNSGGPICNYRGLVVGVAQSVAVAEGGEAPKYGVDIMRIRPVLDKHSDIPSYAGK